jgi:hypothetical protein
MVCYGPRIGTIAVVSAVVYVFWHRVIGRILHIAGLVMEVMLIVCVAAAAAALLVWTVRTVQRRRAATGACTTCRFRCQQSLILGQQPTARRPQPTAPLPQPTTPRPEPGSPRPVALPPRVPVAQAGDRRAARPLVLR